jgi:hypothetical protein
MAVRTPPSVDDGAVEVLQPGEGSERAGRTTAAGGAALLRAGLGCECAGLAEQPAHPMTAATAKTIIAAAMRRRIAGCYAAGLSSGLLSAQEVEHDVVYDVVGRGRLDPGSDRPGQGHLADRLIELHAGPG